MGWLASLIFGGAVAGSAIKSGLEHMECMGTPWHVCEDGTKIYKDGVGKCYCNGEYCVFKNVYGADALVGTRTGNIYWSAAKDRENRIAKENKERLEKAKERGDLAYVRYDAERKKYITTEISTGKEIAGLLCYQDGVHSNG